MNILKTINLPVLGKKFQRKIRDFYILKDSLRLWYKKEVYWRRGNHYRCQKVPVFTMITGRKFAILRTDILIEDRITNNLTTYDIKHE